MVNTSKTLMAVSWRPKTSDLAPGRRGRLALLAAFSGCVFAAWVAPSPIAAQAPGPQPAPASITAFLGVNVVPMDEPRVLAGQTVVVEGGRIAALGSAAEVPVPAGARVIEGGGRYLLPGLVDMHVHLDRRLGSRPDFGDAPLYLAHGVTTVLNLRGEEEQLRWRERIAARELLAPALFTSGDFINEPRVRTPAEIEQEVERQAAAGFDALKFHEIFDFKTGEMLTTRGLSREAYRRLIESARRRGMPLLGHVPERFGVEAALAERQSLAHANAYLFSYFWPRETPAFHALRWLSLGAAGLLAVAAVSCLVTAGVGAWRPGKRSRAASTDPGVPSGHSTDQRRDPRGSRASTKRLAGLGVLGLAMVAIAALAGRELAGLDWLGSRAHLAGFTAAGVAILLFATLVVWLGVATLRRDERRAMRPLVLLTLVAASALSVSLGYWLPLAWRTSDRGLERIAAATARSGIYVATTLTVENIFTPVERPEVRYLVPRLEERWRQWLAKADPARVERARRGIVFFQRLAGALHRAGVPLLAGTDAMGFPWMIPGASLHEELGLLVGSGLTPYEVLRTATVNPAIFLGREGEMGTIAAGQRADLLLVEGNPLLDLAHLRDPAGVIVAGRWVPREELKAMLRALE